MAIKVHLLGAVKASVGNEEIGFANDQRFQLLSYLAYMNTWVMREELAHLFWPDIPSKAARQNLSKLLKRVKAFSWLKNLETKRDQLRWQVSTDVQHFKHALRDNDFPTLHDTYTGNLLAGLEGEENSEFAYWLGYEREYLKSSWRRAMLAYVKSLEKAQDITGVFDIFSSLLGHDPLNETLLQTMMAYALRTGEKTRALEHFQQFEEKLTSLALQPSSSSRFLADQLKTVSESGTVNEPNETGDLSSFVGRDAELKEVKQLLEKPDCRLLTLTGPGGIGKSRMAKEVAERLKTNYQDGVVFVSLNNLQHAKTIPTAIASALNLQLSGQDEPFLQVARHLENKHMLLTLDNFEHLIDGASLASRLIKRCAHLDLLITSRERLVLLEEWLLPIAGLNYPSQNISAEDAMNFDAVKFFVDCVKSKQRSYVLNDEDVQAIIKICSAVKGSPLGLKLLAFWMNQPSAIELAKGIEKAIDFQMLPANASHQTIKAVFEYTWKQLSPTEQTILRKLSVFRGGISKEAAAIITDASIASLSALIDKSLLHMQSNGRITQHPSIHQLAFEQLNAYPEQYTHLRNRHGTYFMRLVCQLEENLHGPLQQQTLTWFEQELDNITAAWDWAITNTKVRYLQQAGRPLRIFFDQHGRFAEGLALFQQALTYLQESIPSHQAALGYLLVNQAWLLVREGKFEASVSQANKGLELLSKNSLGTADGLNTLATVAFFQSQFQEAKDYWAKAMHIAEAKQDTAKTAAFLFNLGIIEEALANVSLAETYHRRSLTLRRKLGDKKSLAKSLNGLGTLLLHTNNAKEAQGLFMEGLELARELDSDLTLAYLLHNLACAANQLKDHEKALELSQTVLGMEQDLDDASFKVNVLDCLARASMGTGNYTEAHKYFAQSLQQVLEINNPPMALHLLTGFAELFLHHRQIKRAARILGFIDSHPALAERTKLLSTNLFDQLKDHLSETKLQHSFNEGTRLTLDEVTLRLLP